jgi:hypothetical protein
MKADKSSTERVRQYRQRQREAKRKLVRVYLDATTAAKLAQLSAAARLPQRRRWRRADRRQVRHRTDSAGHEAKPCREQPLEDEVFQRLREGNTGSAG